MAKLRIGRGKSAIVMDDVMDQIFRRAIDNAQPGLLPILERAVSDLERSARAEWPVKTGTSRAALDSGVRFIGSTGLEAFVVNTADHSPYIRANNLGKKSPYQVLIRRPGIKLGKELADTLGDKLARVLTGQD
tara:strand:+ start:2808 stop:3206 length:399 start_codon:yes stop_codon:yes gene_type:complete